MAVGPRLLVTGFEPFPGAPVNPTEGLIEQLRKEPPEAPSAFRAEVLPVDYEAVGPALSEIGQAFRPDIAIHFGLAAECYGFRLERTARNRFAGARPDNAGAMPSSDRICEGPAEFPSTLPLEAIHDALVVEGLPVEWSDDAGAYLCNMVFTLSRARSAEGFSPPMSGFIHVPPTDARARLANAQLLAGARIAIAQSIATWSASRATGRTA